METRRTDIGDLFNEGLDIVVTTNIGWCPRTFMNNMGAGTALGAYVRFPSLPIWYGHECSRMYHGDCVDVLYRGDLGLYLLPVKPMLDIEDPERSWDQLASYDIITRMLQRFAAMKRRKRTAMTPPGAGNGGLDPVRVRHLVLEHLGDAEDVILCDWQI